MIIQSSYVSAHFSLCLLICILKFFLSQFIYDFAYSVIVFSIATNYRKNSVESVRGLHFGMVTNLQHPPTKKNNINLC